MTIRVLVLLFLLFNVQLGFCQEELGSVKNAQLVLIENVELASRDGGIVVEILTQPGQKSRKNQPVVILDFELNELEVAIAKNELLVAEKNRDNKTDLEFAAKSVEVSNKVLQRSSEAITKYEKVMSQTEFERLELEFEQASLTKKQAQHTLDLNGLTATLSEEQLKVAKLRLRYRSIRSPIAGTVVEVLPQIGEWVAPGEKIARIINLDKLRAEAILPAKLAGQVRVGQSAVFVGHLGETKVETAASVTFVSPEIDPVNQDFKIWAEINNSDGLLRPGIVGQLKLYK